MWEQGSGGPSSWTMGDPRGIVGSSHSFTHGIHVLLVDHEKDSLVSMARMLEFYSYKVTAVQSGSTALSLVLDRNHHFDLVLANIHLPDINSFLLLKESLNRDLPTVFTSANEDAMLAKLALENGACFLLEKPTGSIVLKNLWQHVIKERLYKAKMFGNNENLHRLETTNQNGIRISNPEENNREGRNNSAMNSKKGKKKAQHLGIGAMVDDEAGESDKENRKSAKRFCTEWTDELHRKFMDAVDYLGEGRCYPKEILELMNVPGLTRMQVASHLQKCRNDNWRTQEMRKSNSSNAQTNGSPHKFGSRKFGSMPRLQKNSSSYPQTSHPEESWGHQTSPGMYSTLGNSFMGNGEGEYSVQLIQSQADHMVPNCVGGNVLTQNSSIQSNVEQIETSGINLNATYNGVYLQNATSNGTGDQNIGSLLGKTTNQHSQATMLYFGNPTFGADSVIPDDLFDFLPEIEGNHGFSKYLGGSSTMVYGSIPEAHNAFDVEPIFFDQLIRTPSEPTTRCVELHCTQPPKIQLQPSPPNSHKWEEDFNNPLFLLSKTTQKKE
ncbi:hypothetical protein Vadar_009280 [Vaccinium darrowii]|uniref:Uncharacterized protein n=1 Tax=Vaccinium darrowii TaxID=229202 RepID=A0ACB7ZJJ9_9ERIC|nr:hypothetical protein Vadar_009280 [Vaccinium darrowii]